MLYSYLLWEIVLVGRKFEYNQLDSIGFYEDSPL